MISLNLLPDVKLEYIRTQRTKARVISIAILVTIISIGLVVLVAGWVYGAQTIQKNVLTGQIKDRNKELQALPDIDKYLTIQNQLSHLSQLHAGKNDFSRLLDFLPKLTPADTRAVSLTSLDVKNGELGNVITMQGEAKDYTALNTFRDTLLNAQLVYTVEGVKQEEKLFETVVVSSSSLDSGTGGARVVSFTIDTTYNPTAFVVSTKSAAVQVPNISTTESTRAAPDVFKSSTVQGGQ